MMPVRLQPKRSKYGNEQTWRDGYRFDSKREALCYDWVHTLQVQGDIRYFLRQVPIHLAPAGEHKKTPVLMRVDFVLVLDLDQRPWEKVPGVTYCRATRNVKRYNSDANGLLWIDAKGVPTKDWLNKAAMAENKLGIRIQTW